MTAPPHYHRWLILAITVINQAAAVGVTIYCFSLFSVPWLDRFDINRSELMLSIFVFQVMSGLLSPILGNKLDNIALRLPIILGLIIFCSGLALLSTITAYWQVIAIYAILVPIGTLLAGTFASQLLINRWFTKNKGLALGISATGTSLGGVVFPPLVAGALSNYSVASILLFVSAVFAITLIPLNAYILRYNAPKPVNQSDPDKDAPPPANLSTQAIISSPGFWIPLIALLPVIAAFGAIQHNLGIYLTGLDYPVTFAGQLLSLTSLMMIIGKLLYGKLADHVDHRYLLAFVSGMKIMTLALLIGSPGKIVLVFTAILWGTAGGGLLPLLALVFAARFPPEIFGKVIGLVMLFMILGSFGPVYAGWMYDIFGSYDYAFASLIMLIIPGIIAVKWLPPRIEPTKP